MFHLILATLAQTGAEAAPAVDPLISEFAEALRVAYSNGGWLGVVAVVALFAIRIFRLPFIQSRIPARGRWMAWPEWLKWVAPFALAFIGALLLKYLAGVGWGGAALGALLSAAASIFGHHGTKKLGELEWKHKTGKDPNYKPSPWRNVGSIAIPHPDFYERHGMPKDAATGQGD